MKERNQAQAKAQELEEKLEEKVAKESALMEVRSAHSTCADLKQSIGAAQVREEKLNGDLTELRRKLAESEQLLPENKGEGALTELASASNREETLRGDMAALQGKYDELEQSLASKAGVEESMQEDRDELKPRLLQLEKALEEEKKRTKLLNDTNERLEQSALHSQQKVGELEEESRNLRRNWKQSEISVDFCSGEAGANGCKPGCCSCGTVSFSYCCGKDGNRSI